MAKPLLDTHMKTIPIGLSSSYIEVISKYNLPEITSVCISSIQLSPFHNEENIL
jgi:hypothetical protein